MSNPFIGGGCKAVRVYADNGSTIVADNMSVTLPQVSFGQVETKVAAGNVNLTNTNSIDPMEMTIGKQGVDTGWLKLLSTEAQQLTIDIAMQSIDLQAAGINGATQVQAFVVVSAQGIPSISATHNEMMETEITLNVYSYKVFVDGEEYLHVDPIKGICSIQGDDKNESVRKAIS